MKRELAYVLACGDDVIESLKQIELDLIKLNNTEGRKVAEAMRPVVEAAPAARKWKLTFECCGFVISIEKK